MEGVIILNTIAEEVHAGSLLGFGCIFGIFIILFGIVLTIASLIIEPDAMIAVGIVAILAGICITCVSYPQYGPVIGYNYSYEVIVEDGVNFNEFTEKYKIVDQHGKIYTVIEKEIN